MTFSNITVLIIFALFVLPLIGILVYCVFTEGFDFINWCFEMFNKLIGEDK